MRQRESKEQRSVSGSLEADGKPEIVASSSEQLFTESEQAHVAWGEISSLKFHKISTESIASKVISSSHVSVAEAKTSLAASE